MSICISQNIASLPLRNMNEPMNTFIQRPSKQIVSNFDGEFKKPIPRRPNVLFNKNMSVKPLNMITQKTNDLSKIQQAYKMFQMRVALQQKQKQELQAIRQVRQIIYKKNSNLFLYRMKHLASLPQYKYSIFNIPNPLNLPSDRLLTVKEIDQFISENQLITSNQPNFDHMIEKLVANDQNGRVEIGKIEMNRKEKEVKIVEFRIPEKYWNEIENEENDQSSDSTGISSDEEIEKQVLSNKQKNIGAYSQSERINKILKYKQKIYKRRASKPISKVFKGRSQVANLKKRVNGKFVKSTEAL